MLRISLATRSSKNLLLSRDVVEVDEVGIDDCGDCEDKTVGRLLLKNLNGATSYLTPKARQTVTQLRQTFTVAPIFRHFNLEYHIRIETGA